MRQFISILIILSYGFSQKQHDGRLSVGASVGSFGSEKFDGLATLSGIIRYEFDQNFAQIHYLSTKDFALFVSPTQTFESVSLMAGHRFDSEPFSLFASTGISFSTGQYHGKEIDGSCDGSWFCSDDYETVHRSSLSIPIELEFSFQIYIIRGGVGVNGYIDEYNSSGGWFLRLSFSEPKP